MPATQEQVENLIMNAFPGAKARLETQRGRINGEIIWPQFAEDSPTERNRRVSREVRDRLGIDGLNVGILVPRVSEEDR